MSKQTEIDVLENMEWTKEQKTKQHYKCPDCTKDYGNGVTVYHREGL